MDDEPMFILDGVIVVIGVYVFVVTVAVFVVFVLFDVLPD